MKQICEIASRMRWPRIAAARVTVVAMLAAGMVAAQVSKSPHEAAPMAAHGAKIEGTVQDSNGKPLAKVTVYVEPSNANDSSDLETRTTSTEADGAYRILAIQPGSYMVRAQLEGYRTAFVGPVSLMEKESKRIDLTLTPAGAGVGTEKPGVEVPQLYDAPQFTVAGVADATSSGGHGSDIQLRASEAEVMAKETVALGAETTKDARVVTRTEGSSVPRQASGEETLGGSLRDAPHDAEAHRLLAEAKEKSGDALGAVREYQRAAELDASEENLFAWGTELLAHRALEPALEVLGRGNKLFPQSARIEIALGVAWFERGSFGDATRWMERASDLEPENAVPYLFLGRMQNLENGPLAGAEERFARFAKRHPENALANYYYAVSVWRRLESNGSERNGSQESSEAAQQVEKLLHKAVGLDSKLAPAFLQLGIIDSQRGDVSRAIEEYRKAVETGALSNGGAASLESDEAIAEAHYRLAQAYSRMGEREKAQAELKLHSEIREKIKAEEDRQRKEMKQFVMALEDSARQNN
jgi:tetratricopeptide (TPR) repeat protein